MIALDPDVSPYVARQILDPSSVSAGWEQGVRWLWTGGATPIRGPGLHSVVEDVFFWARLLGGSIPRCSEAWIAESRVGGAWVRLDERGRVYQVGPGEERRVGLLPGSQSDAWPRLVISGAQTGADRGALDAAIQLGVPLGGWVPRGFRSEERDGVPMVYRPYLREAQGWRYEERTTLNILDGDGTLVVSIGAQLAGGSARTLAEARARRRPCLHQVVPGHVVQSSAATWDAATARVLAWLREHRIGVLNVAGRRESMEPGIGAATRFLIMRILGKT